MKNIKEYKRLNNTDKNMNYMKRIKMKKGNIFNDFEICEAEAEAEATAAAPRRRPRAAVINDAFPRPHANFQIFYSKSCF